MEKTAYHRSTQPVTFSHSCQSSRQASSEANQYFSFAGLGDNAFSAIYYSWMHLLYILPLPTPLMCLIIFPLPDWIPASSFLSCVRHTHLLPVLKATAKLPFSRCSDSDLGQGPRKPPSSSKCSALIVAKGENYYLYAWRIIRFSTFRFNSVLSVREIKACFPSALLATYWRCLS